MSGPVVDIGIPVHRRSRFVAEAIAGVVAQSRRDWRLTVSEDGKPTPDVQGVVKPFLADERIRLGSTGEHLGLARHKTSLAARGTGRYLALLDDDDVWDPDWLARRVAFLDEHPACGMVWGGHRDIDEQGRELRRSTPAIAAGLHSSRDVTALLMTRNVIVTPSVLVRRETYVQAGASFDDRFAHINDWELWLRLGMISAAGYLDTHDCGYRVHPGQMSRRHDQAADDLRLIEHLDALLAQHQSDLRLSPAARRRITASTSLSAALDCAEVGDRSAALRLIVSALRLDPRRLASKRALAACAATLAPDAGRRAIARRRS